MEDVEAQIAADLVSARQRLRELQFHPTLDGLDETMATIAVPGSEYYEEQIAYVQELVRLGDVVRLGRSAGGLDRCRAVDFEGRRRTTSGDCDRV